MVLFLTLLSWFTRLTIKCLNGFGFAGTALPGLWVEKYAPQLLSAYASYYQHVIFVTGTNGKTTTQLTLQSILQTNKTHVVNNHSGSNMFRGIATTMLTAGIPVQNSVLLCEVEEATMPILTKYIKPHLIIMTNLLRDQLDAYGELRKSAFYLSESCKNSPLAILVVNADDPMLQLVLAESSHKKVMFSLGESKSLFVYERQEEIEKSIPADYVAKTIETMQDFSTKTIVMSKTHQERAILFQPPGVYNVYNMLAAYAVSQTIGIEEQTVLLGIQNTQSPFGRGEKVILVKDGKTVHIQLFLVKNPAGFSQVWRMLSSLQTPIDLVLGLNDNIADGRDVSWIWDINIIPPQNRELIRNMYFTGQRAHDMALRFKYGQIESINSRIVVSIEKCLADLIQKNNNDRHCHLLMTYTAMNQMRKALGQYVNISPFLS